MDLQLGGKNVFVTGASGGIGRALAEAFAGEGARVALHGHKNVAAMGKWLAGRMWRDRAMTVNADVRSAEQVTSAVRTVENLWGRLDVCVVNAGTWPPAEERLDQMPVGRVMETLAVNLLGALWTARAFMGALARKGPRDDGHGASLVFVGSTAGRFGERGHCDYAASKAALRGVVLSLKNEIVALDPYARVNMVEPGWTVTHMARPALDQPGVISSVVRTMPLRQLARAEDIARAVVSLSSPALSRHVTGQILTVAGGMEGRTLWESAAIDEDAVRARLDQD